MSLWSYLTGVDTAAEQERGDQLDAQLADLNAQALESGRWSQSQYDAAEENRIAGATGDVDAQVRDAFVEGAKEGAANMAGAVNSTLSFTVGNLFRAIPLSVWILAAVALFVWMGGLTMLRGRLKNA